MTKRIDNIFIKRFLYFNIYVIKGVDGDILIDTGFLGIKKNLKKWLDNFNIKLIILTHSHIDHIWNVSYIKQLYNCEVAIGKVDLEYIDNSKINSEPVNKHYKYRTKLMNWGMKKFISQKFDVDMLLEDNQILNKYGLQLKIVSLDGHTNGSIGILYKDFLFAGDALVNRKSKVEIAYQNQSNQNAKKSALKILELEPQLIFIGHENAIKLEKLKKSIDYILKK